MVQSSLSHSSPFRHLHLVVFGSLPFLFLLTQPLVDNHHIFPDQDPAAGHLLHRLPDQRAEVRRPQQWGRGLQGRHPQEVEREVRGAETKRAGETVSNCQDATNIIILLVGFSNP